MIEVLEQTSDGMLRRQKTILALLSEAGNPVSATALVKWAFLLRQETNYVADPTFYDFVPYKFGPFSFALYRELESLQRDGYVSDENNRLRLTERLRKASLEKVRELSQAELSSVTGVLQEYGRMRRRTLLHNVYKRYPHYASKSELADLRVDSEGETPVADPAAYTAGYEGKSVDAFFDGLLRVGIRRVFDVRANPVSRKYGFAGSSMAGIAKKLDLGYTHLPSLGVPSKARVGLGSKASYKRLLDRYERQLPEHAMEVDDLGNHMVALPSVLVCVEGDVECCHRSRLAVAVSKASGLPVRHL